MVELHHIGANCNLSNCNKLGNLLTHIKLYNYNSNFLYRFLAFQVSKL
jgi:CMP-2-keto-3-deoxyoctulosonic acid synthetase